MTAPTDTTVCATVVGGRARVLQTDEGIQLYEPNAKDADAAAFYVAQTVVSGGDAKKQPNAHIPSTLTFAFTP